MVGAAKRLALATVVASLLLGPSNAQSTPATTPSPSSASPASAGSNDGGATPVPSATISDPAGTPAPVQPTNTMAPNVIEPTLVTATPLPSNSGTNTNDTSSTIDGSTNKTTTDATTNTTTVTTGGPQEPCPMLSGWSKLSKKNLPTGFFFQTGFDQKPTALKANEDASKSFFALATHGFGADGAGFVGSTDKLAAKTPVQIAPQNSPSTWLRVLFDVGTQVVLADSQSSVFWTSNGTSLAWTDDKKVATRFELCVSSDQKMLVLQSAKDKLFVEAPLPFDDSSLRLSQFVSDRSVFHSSIDAASSGNGSSLALQETIQKALVTARQTKAEAVSSGSVDERAFLGYDLAILFAKSRQPLGNLTLSKPENLTAYDLVSLVGTSASLLTGPLLESVQGLSFGKDIPTSFDLFSVLLQGIKFESKGFLKYWRNLPRGGSSAASGNGTTPASGNGTSSASGPQQLKKSLELMLLSNVVIQSSAANATIDDDMQAVREAFAVYFGTSCQLAVADPALTISQKVELVAFPQYAVEDLSALYTVPKDSKEAPWYAPFMAKFTTLDDENLASAMAQEIALFRNAPRKYIMAIGIGNLFARLMLEKTQKALEKFDLEALQKLFSNPSISQVVDEINLACSVTSQENPPPLAMCAIRSLSYTIPTILAMQKPEFLDLTSIKDMDMTKAVQNLLSEQGFKENMNALDLTGTEVNEFTSGLATNFTRTVSKDVHDNMVAMIEKLNKDNIEKSKQMRKASLFDMNMVSARIKYKWADLQTKFESSETSKKKMLDILNDIKKSAKTNEKINNLFNAAESATRIFSGQTIQDTVNNLDPRNRDPVGYFLPGSNPYTVPPVPADITNIIKAFKGTTNFAPQLENLNRDLDSVAKQLNDYKPKLENLKLLMDKFMPNGGEVKNMTQLGNASEAILNSTNVMSSQKPQNVFQAITTTKMSVNALIGAMCLLVNSEADVNCAKAGSEVEEYFSYLLNSFTLMDDLFNDFVSLAYSSSSVVNEVAQNSTLATFNLESTETSDADAVLESRFEYQRATNILASFDMKVQLFQTLQMLCTQLTYANLGSPIAGCDSIRGNMFEQASKLSSTIPTPVPYSRTVAVRIPTTPQFDGDLGFIDLPSLLQGHDVIFKLSMDAKTLVANGWIRDEATLTNSVLTLRKFRLVLPPKFSRKQESVTIRITTRGMTDLGPAVGNNTRLFNLPPQTLIVSYTNGLRGCTGVVNPYSICEATQDLCFTEEGKAIATEKAAKQVQMPIGLFSEFNISAAISTRNESDTMIPYHQMVTPMYLLANVELGVSGSAAAAEKTAGAPDSTSPASANPAVETGLPANTSPAPTAVPPSNTNPTVTESPSRMRRRLAPGVCCPKNSYAPDWTVKGFDGTDAGDRGKCAPCPSNTESQLNGLFCAPLSIAINPSQANGTASTNGTAPTNSTAPASAVPTLTPGSGNETVNTPGSTGETAPSDPATTLPSTPSTAPGSEVPVPSSTDGTPVPSVALGSPPSLNGTTASP